MPLAAVLYLAGTLVLLLAAGLLAHQQRWLRRRTIAPHVVLDISERAGEAVVTVVNVGSGPALDVEATLRLVPHTAMAQERPMRAPLPERYDVRRVLAVGEELTFLSPGDGRGERADPGELASRVERIELEVVAADLDGNRHQLSDVLNDPFRRVETLGHRRLTARV